MAENLRQNIPFLSPDREAYMNGLTRTNSDSSGLTAESSIHHLKGVREGQSMFWTDEKHNFYLDLLEATFVQQMHHSMSLCGHRSQEEMQGPSTQSVAREQNSSDQFMVLQDGCRQKRNYGHNESLLDSTADSNDILESHCVHNSTSVCKHYPAMSPQIQKKIVHGKGRNSRSNMDFCVSARNPEQHPDCCSYERNLGGSAAEALGQNFVNEDQGEETNSISRAKRLKVATVDPSSNDQVVPLRKFHLVDNSTIIETETLSKRGKTKLLSEEPESSSDSNSGIHYF
ncbi:hypothetical protein SLA2020_455690 [Shorea laevis]